MERKAALGIMLILLLAIVVMVTFNTASAQADYFVDVDLAYLASHLEDFYGLPVKTWGIAGGYHVTHMCGDYGLKALNGGEIPVIYKFAGLPTPRLGSSIEVTGTIEYAEIEEGFLYLKASSWTTSSWTMPSGKISSWLWNDTLHWLQVDQYHKVSAIIWVYGINQSYVANILVTNHNATITMIGEPNLNCLNADIQAIEVEKVAQYPFIASLGSGTYPSNYIPRIVPSRFAPWNSTVFPDPPANTTLPKQTSEDSSPAEGFPLWIIGIAAVAVGTGVATIVLLKKRKKFFNTCVLFRAREATT